MGSPNKNHSFASTNNPNHNTNSFYSARKTNQRPKTAQLVYANKPYKKPLPHWNQSTATWRNSSKKYSFSKDTRFKTIQGSSLDILQLQIPTSKSKKSCSFGSGIKKAIPGMIIRNAKEKPSPHSYNYSSLDEESRSPQKGRSFGNGYKKYQKQYINHRKDVYSEHFVIDNPGPIYTTRKIVGNEAVSKTINSRQKMFTQKMVDTMHHVPGPKYNPQDRNFYYMVGLNDRNFSYGNRMDLSAPANEYPGPEYTLKGFSQVYRNTKKKNCPSN